MKEPFSFTTYFSNYNLIHQLIKGQIADTLDRNLKKADTYRDVLKNHYTNAAYNESLVQYLTSHDVPPLQKLLVGDQKIKSGTLFWVETTFFFKGAGAAYELLRDGKAPSYFSFKIKFDEFEHKIITGKLNAEHLYTTSAVSELSGKRKKFLIGYIQEVNEEEIIVRTILIGDRVLEDNHMILYDNSTLRLNIYEIDEFQEIKKISYKNPSLNIEQNRSIPEKTIKQWIGDIINEGNIGKDWGGEQSDLFTTHLHIGGEPFRAAFVLKGPSKFHKMEMKDLGKNGDQIARLFDEPADIFILQHCHYISPAVIKTMDAFANQINKPRRYCIIDGIDMLRLFKAYEKT